LTITEANLASHPRLCGVLADGLELERKLHESHPVRAWSKLQELLNALEICLKVPEGEVDEAEASALRQSMREIVSAP
jgi:hypothetical protein